MRLLSHIDVFIKQRISLLYHVLTFPLFRHKITEIALMIANIIGHFKKNSEEKVEMM